MFRTSSVQVYLLSTQMCLVSKTCFAFKHVVYSYVCSFDMFCYMMVKSIYTLFGTPHMFYYILLKYIEQMNIEHVNTEVLLQARISKI